MFKLMKQTLLAASCFEGISNFMQWYHQTVQWFSVFFIMTHERMQERYFASESVT